VGSTLRPVTAPGPAPKVRQVDSEQEVGPVLARLRRARVPGEFARRCVRVPVVVVVAVSVAAFSWHGHPGPGRHGTGLVISLALAGFAVSVLWFATSFERWTRSKFVAMAVLTASAAALLWFQPSTAAAATGLAATCLLTIGQLRRQPRSAAIVTGSFFVGTTVVMSFHRPLPASLVYAIPIVACSVLAILMQRLQDANRQAEELVMQLEERRGAEVRAAALAERQRLAREMHDVLAHSLAGLIIALEGARMLAAAGETGQPDPRLPGTVERAHQLAKDGLDEARRAVGLLRGDELPGPEALGRLAGQFEQDSGIPCSFATAGPPRALRPEAGLALYRVTQEALTNVAKHAAATRVEVSLRYEASRASLAVEDFGAVDPPSGIGGAVAAAAPGGGYGLTGMRERAELLGGTLTTGLTPAGFRVELQVPA
jgi:signal transduction histidine kinase